MTVAAEIKKLSDRLHAARTDPSPLQRMKARQGNPHLFDPDYLDRMLRLTSTDIVINDDSGEDAEPVEPVTRTRRPTLARQTLPPTLPPRLISRDAAAAYVGAHRTPSTT